MERCIYQLLHCIFRHIHIGQNCYRVFVESSCSVKCINSPIMNWWRGGCLKPPWQHPTLSSPLNLGFLNPTSYATFPLAYLTGISHLTPDLPVKKLFSVSGNGHFLLSVTQDKTLGVPLTLLVLSFHIRNPTTSHFHGSLPGFGRGQRPLEPRPLWELPESFPCCQFCSLL